MEPYGALRSLMEPYGAWLQVFGQGLGYKSLQSLEERVKDLQGIIMSGKASQLAKALVEAKLLLKGV